MPIWCATGSTPQELGHLDQKARPRRPKQLEAHHNQKQMIKKEEMTDTQETDKKFRSGVRGQAWVLYYSRSLCS